MIIKDQLLLPRGTITEMTPLVVDMKYIHMMEQRLEDIKIATPDNAGELMGSFNMAANTAMKALASIQYELLMAKQGFDRRKAIVILEVLPEKMQELKENGIKPNEDIREALVTLDKEAFTYRDRIDCLTAAMSLIESKIKSFVRAYNVAKTISETRRHNATSLPMNTASLISNEVSKKIYGEEIDLSFGSED
jgi:hypothetical protein